MRRAGFDRELKPDGTIVTPVDVEVEKLLRRTLVELYPDTNVWGEELGFEEEGEGGLWVVDPIDGTSNFAFGSPLWGISVGLVRDGVIMLGAVFLPDLNELYLAERGRGAFVNGMPLPPIPAGPIRREELVGYDARLLQEFDAKQLPGKMRLSGAFVIDGTFTARQRLRGMIGGGEKLYDAAACILFAEELDAEIRYTDGRPFVIRDLMVDHKIDSSWFIFPKDSGCFPVPGTSP
jgi:myo-inositol-1(or 4)-monophosphatase